MAKKWFEKDVERRRRAVAADRLYLRLVILGLLIVSVGFLIYVIATAP